MAYFSSGQFTHNQAQHNAAAPLGKPVFNHILRIAVLVLLIGMGVFVSHKADNVQHTFDISDENLERLKGISAAELSSPEKAKALFDHFVNMQELQNKYYKEINTVNDSFASFLFSLALIQGAYLVGVYTSNNKRITSRSSKDAQ